MANTVVRSTEKMEGTVKVIAMLEDKADNERIAPGKLPSCISW